MGKKSHLVNDLVRSRSASGIFEIFHGTSLPINEKSSTLIFCIPLRELTYKAAVLAQWLVQFQIDLVRNGQYLSGALCMGRTLSNFAGICTPEIYYSNPVFNIIHDSYYVQCSKWRYHSTSGPYQPQTSGIIYLYEKYTNNV